MVDLIGLFATEGPCFRTSAQVTFVVALESFHAVGVMVWVGVAAMRNSPVIRTSRSMLTTPMPHPLTAELFIVSLVLYVSRFIKHSVSHCSSVIEYRRFTHDPSFIPFLLHSQPDFWSSTRGV